jgi:hypothetical protein
LTLHPINSLRSDTRDGAAPSGVHCGEYSMFLIHQ